MEQSAIVGGVPFAVCPCFSSSTASMRLHMESESNSHTGIYTMHSNTHLWAFAKLSKIASTSPGAGMEVCLYMEGQIPEFSILNSKPLLESTNLALMRVEGAT